MESQKKPQAPYAPSTPEKKWQILYPVYLDKSRSVAEGRRVLQGAALVEPKVEEMAMVCKFLKLEHTVELSKRHPADFFSVGRLRVRLRNDDGTPVLADVASKRVLLAKMAELIPQLKTRAGANAAQAPQQPKGSQKTSKTPTTKKPTAKPGKRK